MNHPLLITLIRLLIAFLMTFVGVKGARTPKALFVVLIILGIIGILANLYNLVQRE